MVVFAKINDKDQRKIATNAKNRQTNDFSQFSQILFRPQLGLV